MVPLPRPVRAQVHNASADLSPLSAGDRCPRNARLDTEPDSQFLTGGFVASDQVSAATPTHSTLITRTIRRTHPKTVNVPSTTHPSSAGWTYPSASSGQSEAVRSRASDSSTDNPASSTTTPSSPVMTPSRTVEKVDPHHQRTVRRRMRRHAAEFVSYATRCPVAHESGQAICGACSGMGRGYATVNSFFSFFLPCQFL
jgi:hypothetical protein